MSSFYGNHGVSGSPGNLPPVTSDDNGKIAGVVLSEWTAIDPESLAQLPYVTSAENGQVLQVVNGQWRAVELPVDLRNLIDGNANGSFQSINAAIEDEDYQIGENAFAEGTNAQASGVNSHAEGLSTIAAGSEQHVSGRFNIADNTALEIIGNGTGSAARSNARLLDAAGNETLAGNLDVNGGSLTLGNTTITENQLKDLLWLLAQTEILQREGT